MLPEKTGVFKRLILHTENAQERKYTAITTNLNLAYTATSLKDTTTHNIPNCVNLLSSSIELKVLEAPKS